MTLVSACTTEDVGDGWGSTISQSARADRFIWEGLVIQDIGSSNGTFVNGKRVQEASLRAGDQIRIGSLRFIVQIDGSPSEDDAHAFTTAAEQTAPETPADRAADRAAEPSGSAAGPSGSRAPVPNAPVHSDADFIDMLDDDENFP